jgi:hypothetical protein
MCQWVLNITWQKGHGSMSNDKKGLLGPAFRAKSRASKVRFDKIRQ